MKLLVLASTYPRWTNDYEPGFVHELAKRLARRFEVTVLCPHAPGAAVKEEMEGVSVIRFRYAPAPMELLVSNGGIVNNLARRPWLWLILPAFFLSMAFSLVRINSRLRPDVMHVHWIIPQGLVVALLRALRIKLPPVLLTSHGGDLFALDSPIFRVVKRYVVATMERFTVVSNAMRIYAERLGVSKEVIRVRSMGVDLGGRFKPAVDPKKSDPVVLFVGRFVEKKGVNILLDSLPSVIAAVPEVSVALVGYGPEDSDLRARVEELGLQQAVRFLGAQNQDRVAQYYRESSVLAAPFVRAKSGDADGLGLVVAEALASGCPVVTTDLPATEDIASGMEGVVTVPSGDAKELANALVKVLMNREEWHLRAVNDRSRLMRQLDWSNVAADYECYLEELVSLDPRNA